MALKTVPATPKPATKPLTFTAIDPPGFGGARSNTQAVRIVHELRAWAAQYRDAEDARELDRALKEIESLFVTVWTVIDESLLHLGIAERRPDEAAHHINAAKSMMHAWQDRGGQVGNVDLSSCRPVKVQREEPSHG